MAILIEGAIAAGTKVAESGRQGILVLSFFILALSNTGATGSFYRRVFSWYLIIGFSCLSSQTFLSNDQNFGQNYIFWLPCL
jgi:hypothetical protein